MRHATWILLLTACAPTAFATSAPNVQLSRKTLDEQAHKISVGVDDRGGGKVFTVSIAAKIQKVPLEVEQGYLSIYDGEKLLVGCLVQARREKDTVNFEFTVAPSHLEKSRFSFLAATATPAERKTLPSGGGWTNYTAMLKEFAIEDKIAPKEPAKSEPPVIKLKSAVQQGDHVYLSFDVINPNAKPLPYLGYTADSFEPKIPEGTISPLFQVEQLRGKERKVNNPGWCGTGIGHVAIPAKGKVTFSAHVLAAEWQEVRIGLVWYATTWEKDSRTAWSSAIDRKDVKKPK